MRLQLTDSARDDLMSIRDYSAEQWGGARRDRYMHAINKRLAELLRHPELGPARDDLGAGFRCLLVGRHAIFYRLEGEDIVVQRVLHQRMDFRCSL